MPPLARNLTSTPIKSWELLLKVPAARMMSSSSSSSKVRPLISIVKRSFSTTSCRASEVVNIASTRHDPPTSSSSSASSKANSPIVLMHGLFGSQRNNRTFTQKLSRPVYTIDLRNHGTSPHHPVHTYTALSEDVEHFLKANEEFKSPSIKPILIGHSMGAKVAMSLALRSPSSYAGIVPIDNAPIDAALKSDFGKYVKAMMEVETVGVTKQSDADKILARYEQELSIRQFLLTNLIKNPDDPAKGSMKFRIPLATLAKSLDNMADFPFKNPDDARYEGPVLVIRGGESRYVADETLPIMGRFFPRFELVDVKGAGHWVVSERFDDCVKAVVDWVGKCIDGDGDKDGKN